MFCANCGQKNDDSANFCLCCGTKLNKYVVAGIEQEKNVIDEVDNELQIISSKTYTDVIDTDSSNENADKTTFIEPIDQVFFYRPGENAYAECVKIVNDVYHFYCIDKLSHFYWGKNLVDRVNPKLKVGDGVWVNLKELTDSKRYVYKAYYTSNANLSLEFKCQTAHCGRGKPHFIFGGLASPMVPYRNLPQASVGMTADCRSLV